MWTEVQNVSNWTLFGCRMHASYFITDIYFQQKRKTTGQALIATLRVLFLTL